MLLHLKLAIIQTGDLFLVSFFSKALKFPEAWARALLGGLYPGWVAHGIVCALGHNLAECSAVWFGKETTHTLLCLSDKSPFPEALCRARFNGVVIKLEICGAYPFYECSTGWVYKFSLKVRDTFKIRIQKNYINNLKNAKEVSNMPSFCHRIVKDLYPWLALDGRDAGRSLHRFYLSGNNFIGTRICILDTFFFFFWGWFLWNLWTRNPIPLPAEGKHVCS